jgi:hypothetical protein
MINFSPNAPAASNSACLPSQGSYHYLAQSMQALLNTSATFESETLTRFKVYLKSGQGSKENK